MKKGQTKSWYVWINGDGIMGPAVYCRQAYAEIQRDRDLKEVEELIKKAKGEEDEKALILLNQIKDNIDKSKLYELKSKWGSIIPKECKK